MPPQSTTAAIQCSEDGAAPAGKGSAKGGPDSKKLATMEQAVPDSTSAERQRFLADWDGDTEVASEKLRLYLEWREENHDPSMAHLDSWTYASQLAIRKLSQEKGEEVDVVAEAAKIPHVIYLHEQTETVKNDEGEDVVIQRKVYQLLLGRLDIKIAEPETYAHILALYIDHVLDRDSTERYTIVADLREGYGWANIPALQHLYMVPFLQSQAVILQDLFPARIESILVFPIPSMFAYGWDMIVPYLMKDVMNRVHLVPGWGTGKDDAPPDGPDGLGKYLDEGTIAEMERTRESTFIR